MPRQLHREVTPERIIDVDHCRPQAGPREQFCFRGAVIFHAAVIVEMIAGEIREHRDFEVDRIDAALLKSVRGHFHRHVARAVIAETREQGLHADRIGRRACPVPTTRFGDVEALGHPPAKAGVQRRIFVDRSGLARDHLSCSTALRATRAA